MFEREVTRDPKELPARRGVYTAARASALSGVPISTVYDWAREKRSVLVPSVSSSRVKLWSWADLVALRAIYWLRHPLSEDDRDATSMGRVKDLIQVVEEKAGRLGEALSQESLTLRVDRRGRIYLDSDGVMTMSRSWVQTVGRELVVDLVSTFSVDESLAGPHLRTPRANLRIVPGKLAGEPHIVETRIETRVLAALSGRGMPFFDILTLYPDVSEGALGESLDLERQLERNLRAAA